MGFSFAPWAERSGGDTIEVTLRIAIASSGLGHIARGVEAWACDLAAALHQHGVEVTLFAAGPVSSGGADAGGARVCVLPCLRRSDRRAVSLARAAPRFAWRWGLTSPYGVEQFSFWLHLWPVLRRERFDLLHVQDPMLAYWCRRLRQVGLVKTKEILAHGTEESAAFVSAFDRVQHLAPWHLEQALAMGDGPAASDLRPFWVVIPNFVDTERFRPVAADPILTRERLELRARLALPATARVVFCAAAVKRKHKRIDYLIREFSAFGGGPAGGDACLVISGARGEDSAELVALAQALGGSRIRVLTDVPRNQMPALYRASDVFALTSQFEMLGIVLLEAMASGLPCLGHDHPVLRWVIGPGGRNLDLSRDGALAEALREAVTAAWCRDRGHAAREQVLRRFSKEIVTRQCIRFYSQVLGVPMPVVPAS